jgi:sugar-specific transcriptional regulator TrmB
LSQERIFRTLLSLGLSQTDFNVYLLLAAKGPKKAKNIANSLKITKQQLYSSLKKLKNRRIITVTSHHPATYSAVTFEKVIDQIINVKVDQSKAIKENKDQLLAIWDSIESKKKNNTKYS